MYETDHVQDGFCLFYYVQDDIVGYRKPYILAHQTISYCLRSSGDNILIPNFNFDPRSNNPILGSHRIPSNPIGSNTEFYRILQEFDGSDAILVTESHWIPTVSDPIGSYVGSRRNRNMDFLDFLRAIIEYS
ncbi:unnamed protein product [Adineta ricciae]|uniref:Uncharacterized protein n=1 Tax=Adineta ricciae TaxID=249248 RepID=A0A815Z7J8_ADIRI|nr:unnamed protein product [Adineta ricciae]CAF1581245.1 unnamed protein product [Adineta ricciae]